MSSRTTSPENVGPASALKANRNFAQEKAFAALLQESIGASVRDTLGLAILGTLRERSLLDNPTNPPEFDKQLRSIFGNAAETLERIIVKELYKRLDIRYNSQAYGGYEDALDIAKEVVFVEQRRR